jgi:hypothetical protein
MHGYGPDHYFSHPILHSVSLHTCSTSQPFHGRLTVPGTTETIVAPLAKAPLFLEESTPS